MSSDARLRQTDDGLWFGDHDGPCIGRRSDTHGKATMLSDKIEEIQACTGMLFWIIDDQNGFANMRRMRGWRAR